MRKFGKKAKALTKPIKLTSKTKEEIDYIQEQIKELFYNSDNMAKYKLENQAKLAIKKLNDFKDEQNRK